MVLRLTHFTDTFGNVDLFSDVANTEKTSNVIVGSPTTHQKNNPAASRQISFAQAEYDKKKKRTRREVFLEKLEHVVPWSRLMKVIEPYYPKSGKRGRPPIGLERTAGLP